MEGLTINDAPSDASSIPGGGPPLGPGSTPATQGPPQLPPQMFTTAAQLLDLTDKKLLLVLRDGRKLIGVLRSWDQFANLVLTDTKERYYVTIPHSLPPQTNTSSSSPPPPPPAPTEQEPRRLYCDVSRGTYLVRGENVLVLGEIDLDRDDEAPVGYEEGNVEEVFALQREGERMRKEGDRVRGRQAGEFWGGELEASGEVLF